MNSTTNRRRFYIAETTNSSRNRTTIDADPFTVLVQSTTNQLEYETTTCLSKNQPSYNHQDNNNNSLQIHLQPLGASSSRKIDLNNTKRASKMTNN